MKRILSLLVVAGLLSASAAEADVTLLNASYDPTRELYKDLGAAFAASYKADHVTISTSNGGSGAQADLKPVVVMGEREQDSPQASGEDIASLTAPHAGNAQRSATVEPVSR